MAGHVNLPTGTVTFLFTDIEGSTKRWEAHPDAMHSALARHDGIMREAIESQGGYVFKTMGDAFCSAFPTAPQAVAAALQAQRELRAFDWSTLGLEPLQARMALHTGSAEIRDNDYFGLPLNRVARLLATGHGGQILLSLATQQLVRDQLPQGTDLRDLGSGGLRDLVWTQAPDLRGERKLALLAMADWANDEGYCWPSLNSLARKCSIARRSALRIVQHLEQAGYVTSIPGRGRGHPNRYHLNFPPVKGATLGALPGEKGTPATQKGDSDDIEKETPATGKGANLRNKRGPSYAQSVPEPLLTVIKPSDIKPSVQPGAVAPGRTPPFMNNNIQRTVPCKEPGCGNLTTNRSGYCTPHLPPLRNIPPRR
jgi:hypothetical protein